MIPQRRKSIETSVVGSEKLAGVSAHAERAWWRLYFATDHFGTVDITDVRRLRLAILGEVERFESNHALEVAITELIDAGLMVEWSQVWHERDRRFLHVVNHDKRQTKQFLKDSRRGEARCSPVPPFECCDHARELSEEVAALGPACVIVRGVRCTALHCAALSRIAGQASEPAWGLDAAHCGATPRAGKREEELAADESPTSADRCACRLDLASVDLGNPHPTATEGWAQHEAALDPLRRRQASLEALANPDPEMHIFGSHRPSRLDLTGRDLAARAHPRIGPQSAGERDSSGSSDGRSAARDVSTPQSASLSTPTTGDHAA